MIQAMHIVWAAGAAAALGILNVQACAADLPARGAAMFQVDAIGHFKRPAKAGDGSISALQSAARDGVARGESADGQDSRWWNRAFFPGLAQSGLRLESGCTGSATWADNWFDKADRACARGLTASWKIAGSLSNAAPAVLSTRAKALPLVPPELDPASEVQATTGLWRPALAGCALLLLAYAGYLAALALLQRRFVFNPTHADGPAAEPSDTHELTSVSLALAHDKAIRGWFLRPRQGNAACPSIIYYGGRSEEVSWLRGAVKWFPEHAVLALNYRGYGESEGDPSERGLFEDGLAQFDWLAQQPGVDPKAIVLVGRSLGTGVASYVAAKRPAARVVLITPYDSLLALARRRFWFTPLSLLLRHKFRSVDYAKSNRQPCLALLAEHDDVVPEEHTHRLMAAWAGAKKLVRIPCTTHLDIPYQAATLTAVAIWLGYATVPSGPLALIARAT